MKEKAKELLGFNLPNNVVASAVGCSEGLISQWMSDEVFAAEVQKLRIENLAGAAGRDRKYNNIEDALLSRLEDFLENKIYFMQPREILHALKLVNSAVRRGAPAELAHQSQSAVIPLQLPGGTEFAVRFIMNKDNQVVEIAGRSVATLGAKAVVKQLEVYKDNEKKNKELGEKDLEAAKSKLESLVKLTHLPVAEVL